SPDVVQLATTLAGRGFLTVAISGRYFGKSGGMGDYVAAMKAAYAHPGQDYPFLYDTVWDVMRLIDYLVSRDDVDPNRIGLIGFSKGGMETYLAAAVDPRIAVAVPMIGVQSFRWALDNNAWQSRVGTIQPAIDGAARDEGKSEINADFVRHFYNRVVPGIAD